MKSQWDVRIDTIWEGSPGLFHFPSPTPPLLSPPPQSQLLVKEPSWVGGWCTQSIWMLPFQLLYYWAVSPALLLPFICRQDLVKLFRMVLNSLNTKGEFSTFYHLSSASRVAGTSEMYHYAQQILCFKLFTVFETKIQKKKTKNECCLSCTFPRMPTPWPSGQWSHPASPHLKDRHNNGVVLTGNHLSSPASLSSLQSYSVQSHSMQDARECLLSFFQKSEKTILQKRIKSPFLSKERSWKWHLNHLRDTQMNVDVHMQLTISSDTAALDASELGRDSLRRQLTSQKEIIWQMERIL